MGLLRYGRPVTKTPLTKLPVDLAHPMAHGLREFITFAEPYNPIQHVHNEHDGFASLTFSTGSGTTTTRDSIVGQGTRQDGGYCRWTGEAYAGIQGNGPTAWAALVTGVTHSAGSGDRLVRIMWADGSWRDEMIFQISATGGSSAMTLRGQRNVNIPITLRVEAPNGFYHNEDTYFVYMRHGDSDEDPNLGDFGIIVRLNDGEAVVDSNASDSTNWRAGGVIPLIQFGNDSTNDVLAHAFWWWDKPLPFQEAHVYDFAMKPWSMFEKEVSYFVPSGAAAPTGTAAQTLPAITQSATGEQPHEGTSSQTLPALTQSAAGEQPHDGTSAQTLPSLTQAGTGTHTAAGATGTATQTLPSLNQSAAGEQPHEGTAAQTLPALSQAGDGVMQPSGTAAQQLPSLTQQASGTGGEVEEPAAPAEPIYQGGAGIVYGREPLRRRRRKVTPRVLELPSADERDLRDIMDILDLLDAVDRAA